MADFADELTTFIKGCTASTIGAGDNARIYGDFVRQSVIRPYVVLFEGGGQASSLLVGSSGRAQSSFQVWSFADTPAESTGLWEAIRINLDRYRGTMGDTFVHEVTQVGWRDTGVIQPRDNSPARVFYTQSTYDIWHDVPCVNNQGA